ncbi:hypothetical protein [Fluviicola taffensis]|uniref:Lipoprotein n=1 Tax=Fluviicola taffensis (strain DSM 16823 / NCIMB 13979 / RW262) TaxID=755732 RepID=F2II99_FLUTR|nr:hypothetical protein [Fluviicola taffensis]AEA43808.1 hypothetical protein Fluta_1821 [Fluviicola taffensis DSM 16823]
MKKVSISILLVILVSCTKFGKTDTAKGRVLNPVTGEGISGVELKLLKSTAGLPGGNKAVKTATTDGDGFYEISKAGLKGYSLSCNLPADYYPLGWFIDGELKNTNTGNVGLKKGKTLHADFYAVPYAHLQLDIHNVSCQGATDHFKLYAEGTQADMGKYGLMIDETGCYQFTTSGHSKVPMGARYYRWEVTKNVITTIFYDTVYLAEGEYKTYTINY